MNSAIERLLTLKVSDVMTKKVVHVDVQQQMGEAATVLMENGVSGAPAIDDTSQCKGMLTASDFLRLAGCCRLADPPPAEPSSAERHDSASQDHVESDGIGPMIRDPVSSHMSTPVLTISPEATLLEAARQMCAKHVHRLMVLDASKRVLGLISSLDAVAAMIHAIEE